MNAQDRLLYDRGWAKAFGDWWQTPVTARGMLKTRYDFNGRSVTARSCHADDSFAIGWMHRLQRLAGLRLGRTAVKEDRLGSS